MKWETILKAPLTLASRETRNENYKEAIIAYESNTIETKLGEFIGQRPALENFPIYIGFTQDASKHEKVGEAGTMNPFIYFQMHLESVPELGMNKTFIVDTIGDLYKKEGYKVLTRGVNLNGEIAAKVEQP